MGIVVIVISSSDNDKLSSPLNFFYLEICGKRKSKHNEVVEKRKVALSNILVFITANALAHLISSMSGRI